MTQNGQAFELQMQVRPTKDLESSSLPTPRANEPGSTSVGYGDSLNDFADRVVKGYARKDLELLRTPVASEAEGGAVAPDVAKANGQTLRLSGQMIDMVAPDQLPKLPTPTTRDYKDGSQPHERDGKVQTDTVARAIINSGEVKLFNTPTTMDAKATNNASVAQKFLDQGRQTCLTYDVATTVLLGTPRANAAESSSKQVELGAPKSRIEDQVKLLKTPIAKEGLNGNTQTTTQKKGQLWLSNDVQDISLVNGLREQTVNINLGEYASVKWGKFEPAIRRWEAITGRPAPEPTKPDGRDSAHRLSSKFTEWMMGLPDNWITGHDLKRNDELKLAGNGVVPQQAELALRLLLELPEHHSVSTVSKT
jgi:hypothetical protein